MGFNSLVVHSLHFGLVLNTYLAAVWLLEVSTASLASNLAFASNLGSKFGFNGLGHRVSDASDNGLPPLHPLESDRKVTGSAPLVNLPLPTEVTSPIMFDRHFPNHQSGVGSPNQQHQLSLSGINFGEEGMRHGHRSTHFGDLMNLGSLMSHRQQKGGGGGPVQHAVPNLPPSGGHDGSSRRNGPDGTSFLGSFMLHGVGAPFARLREGDAGEGIHWPLRHGEDSGALVAASVTSGSQASPTFASRLMNSFKQETTPSVTGAPWLHAMERRGGNGDGKERDKDRGGLGAMASLLLHSSGVEVPSEPKVLEPPTKEPARPFAGDAGEGEFLFPKLQQSDVTSWKKLAAVNEHRLGPS